MLPSSTLSVLILLFLPVPLFHCWSRCGHSGSRHTCRWFPNYWASVTSTPLRLLLCLRYASFPVYLCPPSCCCCCLIFYWTHVASLLILTFHPKHIHTPLHTHTRRLFLSHSSEGKQITEHYHRLRAHNNVCAHKGTWIILASAGFILFYG